MFAVAVPAIVVAVAVALGVLSLAPRPAAPPTFSTHPRVPPNFQTLPRATFAGLLPATGQQPDAASALAALRLVADRFCPHARQVSTLVRVGVDGWTQASGELGFPTGAGVDVALRWDGAAYRWSGNAILQECP